MEIYLEHFVPKTIFAPQLRIGLLCNGSTTDFGSVCLGSNPGRPTKNLLKREIFLFNPFFSRWIFIFLYQVYASHLLNEPG